MNKYSPLESYLSKQNGTWFKMTLEEIEGILGDTLPKSAYTYSAWWANGEQAHQHSLSWVSVGWKVDTVEFGKYVIFKKI